MHQFIKYVLGQIMAVTSSPAMIDLMRTVSVGTSSSPKISNNYNINETFSALATLKDAHSSSNFNDLITKLDNISKTTMKRPNKTDCPSAGTLLKSRFNQSFMKNGQLCPAQVELMQYIDPNLYNIWPKGEQLYSYFDAQKWGSNYSSGNSNNNLKFLGEFFNEDKSIIDQLNKWDSDNKFSFETGGKMTLNIPT